MRLALYQPDIPQNTGAALRLAACFKVPMDIIEPCGFLFEDKRLRRSAMDYGAACEFIRHASWNSYLAGFRAQALGRLVLLSTAAEVNHTDFIFAPGDTLLLGQAKSRRSSGRPRRRRRAGAHPHRRRDALAQRGCGGGHRARRSVAPRGHFHRPNKPLALSPNLGV